MGKVKLGKIIDLDDMVEGIVASQEDDLFNVGENVEVYISQQDRWAKVKILAFDCNNVIWRNGSDGRSYIGTPLEYVRKLKPTITKSQAWDMLKKLPQNHYEMHSSIMQVEEEYHIVEG